MCYFESWETGIKNRQWIVATVLMTLLQEGTKEEISEANIRKGRGKENQAKKENSFEKTQNH